MTPTMYERKVVHWWCGLLSEGLVDSEKVLGRTQAHTMEHLEELVNISNLRCSQCFFEICEVDEDW